MPDRSGGREVKGASLKQSKKNPGCPTANRKKVAKVEGSGPSISAPPPAPRSGKYMDCGAALLSRQFDRDRDRVILRAEQENISSILCWFSDIEKLSALMDLAKSNPGFCYYLAGAHPDNVDKTNKKSHDGWMEKVEEAGRKPECLGILSGLNLTREMATHFSQESLLKASCRLADKLLLPLVIHVACDGDSLDKVFDVLRSEGWTNESECLAETIGLHRVLLYDAVTACAGDIDKLDMAIKAGFYFIISASGLDEEHIAMRERTQRFISHIPINKLLVCSDSPWRTPQNLNDAYLRTQRNEPSNISFIMKGIHEISGSDLTIDDFSRIIKNTSLQIFGMEFLSDDQVTSMLEQDSLMNEPMSKSEKAAAVEPKLKLTIVDNAKMEYLEKSQVYFGCLRCRARLFCPPDVMNHALNAIKTAVFNVGEEGLCHSVIFVGCDSEMDLSTHTKLAVTSGNVVCADCRAKLGRYNSGDAFCACGVSVAGPSARLIACKLDFFDGVNDAETLAARARLEAEESNIFDLEQDDRDMERRKIKKGTKARAKQRSERGKGNFSEFRNKTFITPGMKVARGDNNEKKKGPTTLSKKERVALARSHPDYAGYTGEEDDEDEDEEDSDGEEMEEEEESEPEMASGTAGTNEIEVKQK